MLIDIIIAGGSIFCIYLIALSYNKVLLLSVLLLSVYPRSLPIQD